MVKDKSFYAHLLLLTIPIMMQNIVTYSVSLADNVMVSSLGEIPLSGVYVVNQVTVLVQRLMQGLTAGMTVLASQYWGKGNIKSVKDVVAIGLKISVVTSFIMGLSLTLFTPQILKLFTDETATIQAGIEYGKIIGVTYIFFCISNTLISAFQCVETVRLGMIVSISALIVNISFNWLLIGGNLGVPAFGAKGAAMATLIARIVEFAIVFAYTMWFDKKLLFRFKDLWHTQKVLYIDFIKYGLPITVGSVSWGINLAIQGAIIGRLTWVAISTEKIIAAYSISNIFFQIITVGAYGAAGSSSIIIGKAVGSGDIERVKDYAKTLQVVFVVIGVFTGAIMLLSQGMIPVIYRDMERDTLDLAVQFLIVLSFMSIGTSYQMAALTGIVRAGGATSFVLFNDLVFVYLIVLPASFLSAFVFHAHPWVVVLCLKCDQILKCLVAVVKVNRFNWIKKLTREV